MESDEELMIRVARGDEQALATLVERHAGSLEGFLRRLTGSATDAEDLLQETWVRVARACGTFDPARRFRSWVFGIALNLARDLRRRREVRARAPADPPPEPRRGQLEEGIDLRARIASLPRRLREVLVLRYYGGLGEAEMAGVLGVPRGTVKSRLHAAIQALEQAYREER